MQPAHICCTATYACAVKVQSRACHTPCKPALIKTVASPKHIKRACSLQDTPPHRPAYIGITCTTYIPRHPLPHVAAPGHIKRTCSLQDTRASEVG